MAMAIFLLYFTIFIIICYLLKKYFNGPLNPIKKDLKGKIIVVTGSSDGIGLTTAKDLLNSNAKVIFACRNKQKTEKIINSLDDNLKKNAIFIPLDLSSFKSIENFVKEIKSKFSKINILINNAGMGARFVSKTEDGYINAYQVNYLGTVLLTLLLINNFEENESKIINVSSRGYLFSKLTYGDSKYLNNYDLMYDYFLKQNSQLIFYGNTKLLLNYFTQYLSDLTDKKYPYLKAVCLHPGMIFTNIFQYKNQLHKIFFNLVIKNIFYLISKDLVHGAQTTLFCAYSDNKDLINGAFYNNLKVVQYSPKAKDDKLRKEMINETLKILKEKYSELSYLPLIE